MRLVLAVLARRVARRVAAPAIVIALAMLLLENSSFARDNLRHPTAAVERIVQSIEHDLQQANRKAFRR